MQSLASRSKEIHMQNARMVELEKLLAHNPYQSPTKSFQKDKGKKIETMSDFASSEEFNAMKKENTMVRHFFPFIFIYSSTISYAFLT